jgi:hypothetical protein
MCFAWSFNGAEKIVLEPNWEEYRSPVTYMRLFQSSGHHGQLELLEMDVEPGFAVLMYGTIPKETS